MITFGYITKLNNPGDNLFEVSVPIFDKAGTPTSPDVLSSSTFQANLAYNPGNLNAYRVGDCVIVGFLNNKLSMPIILGKLYVGDETSATNYSFANALKVLNTASLPEDTTIGNISVKTLRENILKINNSVDRLDELGNTSDLEERVEDLEDRADSVDDDIANLEQAVSQISESTNRVITMTMTDTSLHINFHNFDSSDVGRKIYLYRTARRGTKRFRHPANYDSISTEKFGYGSVAGGPRKDMPNYPALPSWMPRNGYIETEWTITQTMITNGGFSINWVTDWLPLVSVRYDGSEDEDYWSEIYSTSDHMTRLRSIKFKFGLVTSEGKLISLSPSCVYFGRQKSADRESVVEPDENDNMHINPQLIYRTVK